ncbi:MAG: class I SAM-dependent methyltransferase [Rhodospirillaceae bacterium]|jgi:SAM-dependent methyltransferase|nr:class I SAM-dependent methyltransferase [Rhodospirillaceae bacterium]MBT7485667.1 class I SAM-dependent methyltransferase [Rhodospirillales bacterium]MBT4700936.1 class I SAM-dependent methyltransferase [Rhodospirillaceae bacterium]MBT5035072.1 class I SAM-dependent methyltransferase [Rhodospirillaceae bacterium]MBT6222226.1 class I SAM-dependent methyltransferase [Rhodospirillaceae bacterium]
MVSETLKKAPEILAPVAVIYDQRVKKYGAQAKGVYWSSRDNQVQRFRILTTLFGEDAQNGDFSVNDFGCGYGAYYTFLKKLKMKKPFRYFGIDISEEMIKKCESRIKDPNARFTQALIAHQSADYTIASGTYSMMSDTPIKDWEDYIRASLVDLWMQTRKGLGFNILNAGSMPADSALYTATSGPYVEFCKQELSPNVQLLNDYHPDEWTIFVRR